MSLEYLNCSYNSLIRFPVLPKKLKYCKLFGNERARKICCRKIENWFLKCKYNPKYKYCRDRLEKEYHNLNI